MKGRRNSNIFVLGAILLVVLSLTIGFAAFSTVLRIASGARILPPEKEWNVVFSSSNESYQTKPVVPTKSSNAVTALDGVINNTENPTISNLEATFSDPGQTVTYDFYVYNMGRTDAFINSIVFEGEKECAGVNGVTGENTQAACDAISISVTVGDVTVTNTTSNMQQALAKKEFKPVRVVLSYAEDGSYPDESFDVVFPNLAIYVADAIDDKEPRPRGKTYLTSFSSDISANDYFKEEAYKENIKNVYFVNYVDTTNALTTYDLSEDKDESITGWIVANTSDTSKYDLYIGSKEKIYTKNFGYAFNEMTGIEKIEFNNLNTSENTSFAETFANCSNLTTLDVSHFDTSKVTLMNSMFHRCESLTSLDVSHFDTSKVTDMNGMFHRCGGLTSIDVSHFDTSNVTNMNGMFCLCSGLTTLDLSSFDTSKVTDMTIMFGGCSGLTSLDLSNFNTSRVTYMDGMFSGCSNLTSLDLSSFYTSGVTSMSSMFLECSNLTSLDLSSFDTSVVKAMQEMFMDCGKLVTIYVTSYKFTTSSLSYAAGSNMFSGCNSLVGGAGTTYDENNTGMRYARIDGGTSNPGYFTAKA